MKRCLNCMEVFDEIYEVCPHCRFVEEEYMHHRCDMLIETIIGNRYIIGTRLGQGGFGITYMGWDTVLRAKVAVKEYYPHGHVERDITSNHITAVNEESRKIFDAGLDRFLNEARMLAQFNKEPDIVHVYDYLQENNTAYIIMEFIEGKTLDKYVAQYEKEHMGTDEAVSIISNIAAALSKLHHADIVHRDVSLENIMITEDGSIKMLDFGAAGEHGKAVDEKGVTVLKQSYAPLEQYDENADADERADIYSLGAVMYHMLTGKAPVPSLDRRMKDTLKKPSISNKDIPSWMDNIVLKCMELYPQNRYADIESILNAIDRKETHKAGKGFQKKGIIGIAIFVICTVAIMGVSSMNEDNVPGDVDTAGVQQGEQIMEDSIITAAEEEPVLAESTFNCMQHDDGSWMFTPILVVENKNTDVVLTALGVEIDAKNAEGKSIYKYTYPIWSFISPGCTSVVAENVEVPEEVASVDYKLSDIDHMWTHVSDLKHEEYVPMELNSTQVLGGLYDIEVINENNYRVQSAMVCALYRDENGNLTGGFYDWVERIPPNSSETYELYFYKAETYGISEFYIVPADETD